MSARWDTGQVAHDPAFWAEVLRVAKPGAFLLAFGGTRTYHRLACAVEDGGWELRDMIVHWLYGSGFPKSTSCLKPSQEPIVLAKAPGPLQPLQIDACRVGFQGEADKSESTAKNQHGDFGSGQRHNRVYGTDAAERTNYRAPGRWPPNTLLSHHPECQLAGVRRVRGNGHHPATRGNGGLGTAGHSGQQGLTERHLNDEAMPAYACVDGCPIKALDEQAGPRTSGANHASHNKPTPGWRFKGTATGHWPANTGNASRFFPTFGPDPQDAVPFRYCSKASRREREAGLDDAPRHDGGAYAGGGGLPGRTCVNGQWVQTGTWQEPNRTPRANNHPTVKPAALMAWLCKLVTPERGVVLDCFAGSGSTGVACVREGFGFIGIEQDAGYVEIARARIAHEQERRDGQLALPLGHAYG